MKKLFITLFGLGLVAPIFADDAASPLTDESSRVSYAIGINIGENLKRQGVDVNPEILARAIKDVTTGGTPLMTDADVKQTLQSFQTELRARTLAKNKVAGDAFLATNKLTAGVQTLPVLLPGGKSSELQYLVLTNGDGAMPKATDEVTVNYRGTLLDGTEFDSSYKRNQPASFPVTGVIKGWTEALQHMAVGSKWKLFIPAELAYGEQGRPGIPPDSLLIFEVELLNIKAGSPPPAPATPVAPLTSDIIKVPSADELKKGAKIEVIKPEDVQKLQQQSQTNN